MKRINIEKVTKVLVYIAFAMYTTLLMYEDTLWGIGETKDILNTIKQICFIVFMFKILLDGIKGRQVPIILIPILIVSLLIYMYTDSDMIISLIILIIAIRKYDLKELIKLIFLIYCVFYGITIFASLVNIIPDWIYQRNDIIYRHSLGFYYPTITIGFYFVIISMYCYIRKSKAKYIEIFCLQMINYFLYRYTDSRLSFILITVLLLIMLLCKVLKNQKEKIKNIFNKKIIKIICYMFPFILMVLMLILTHMYSMDNEIAIYLNEILSDRLDLNYKALNRYNIGLWGTKIKWNRMGILWISYTSSTKLLL